MIKSSTNFAPSDSYIVNLCVLFLSKKEEKEEKEKRKKKEGRN
jgi:hypothetical protein